MTGTSLSNQVAKSPPTVAAGAVQVPVTSSMCVNSPTPILLQTAKAIVFIDFPDSAWELSLLTTIIINFHMDTTLTWHLGT